MNFFIIIKWKSKNVFLCKIVESFLRKLSSTKSRCLFDRMHIHHNLFSLFHRYSQQYVKNMIDINNAWQLTKKRKLLNMKSREMKKQTDSSHTWSVPALRVNGHVNFQHPKIQESRFVIDTYIPSVYV